MSKTVIGTSDLITVKHYSAGVFMEVVPQSFFLSKFIGPIQKIGKYRQESSPDYPIQMITNLENEAGDAVSYDLFYRAKGIPIIGDNILRGNEMNLSWASDTVNIDQVRQGFNCGGKMTRKRTAHDLNAIAKVQGGGWTAEIVDEMFFAYFAGDRGDDTAIWILPTGTPAVLGINTLTAPQSGRAIYGGDATTTASIDAADKFTIDLIDKGVAMLDTSTPFIRPCKMGGQKFRGVAVLHPFCIHDLRTNTGEGQWQDIVKAVGVRGTNNPIFQGDDFVGIHNGVAIFKHPKVVRNTDWGAGTVYGARNLLLGAQAGVIAWGAPKKGERFTWHEELEDRGNQQILDFGAMFGIKRCIFTDPADSTAKDNGMITINTACANPNTSTGAL